MLIVLYPVAEAVCIFDRVRTYYCFNSQTGLVLFRCHQLYHAISLDLTCSSSSQELRILTSLLLNKGMIDYLFQLNVVGLFYSLILRELPSMF